MATISISAATCPTALTLTALKSEDLEASHCQAGQTGALSVNRCLDGDSVLGDPATARSILDLSQTADGLRGDEKPAFRGLERGDRRVGKDPWALPSIYPPLASQPKRDRVLLAFFVPRINAMRTHVIENKTLPRFPSWTSPVRIRSPAPFFQSLTEGCVICALFVLRLQSARR